MKKLIFCLIITLNILQANCQLTYSRLEEWVDVELQLLNAYIEYGSYNCALNMVEDSSDFDFMVTAFKNYYSNKCLDYKIIPLTNIKVHKVDFDSVGLSRLWISANFLRKDSVKVNVYITATIHYDNESKPIIKFCNRYGTSHDDKPSWWLKKIR